MVVSSQNLQLTGKSQSPFAEVWMIFPGGSTPFFTRARIYYQEHPVLTSSGETPLGISSNYPGPR